MEISQIREGGLVKLIEMAGREGWNPGIHDAQTFYKVYPEGFVGVEEGNTFAGGGAIVRHSDRFGFMGLFIVAPEFRGRGVGRELWYARRNRLLDRLAEGATIGMDGVSAMLGFYEKGGFVPQYLSSRFQGLSNVDHPGRDGRVMPILDSDFEALQELDLRCFPGERTAYLSAWLNQPGAHHLCFRQDRGGIPGFGSLRPCLVGWKVGPLFAETADIANALLTSLMAKVCGERVSIDVPSCNPDAERLCQAFGMERVFECTRMYYGPKPSYDPSLIYGLTSFELG